MRQDIHKVMNQALQDFNKASMALSRTIERETKKQLPIFPIKKYGA